MNISCEEILNLIPQQKPFRFIDKLSHVDAEVSKGNYVFKEDEYFYDGHFPGKPITPGVIVTECMAQIGLIPLGIYNLLSTDPNIELSNITPVFTSSRVDYLNPHYPGQVLIVQATKVYFRFGKLKAKIIAWNDDNIQICKGEFSGMFIKDKK